MSVARHPPAEFVRQAEGCIERADGDRSAPPTAAAKQATVVRSMFTQGSRLLIIRQAVTAFSFIARAGSVAPQASATRAHILRAARSLPMARN